jgi:hypothetical protein
VTNDVNVERLSVKTLCRPHEVHLGVTWLQGGGGLKAAHLLLKVETMVLSGIPQSIAKNLLRTAIPSMT